MYGVFPPGTGWKIPDEVPSDKRLPPYQTNFSDVFDTKDSLYLGFQPVPIMNMEDILNDPCPNAGLILSKRYKDISKDLAKLQAEQSPIMAKAKLVFNLSATQMTVSTMSDLYDTIISDLTLGH